MGYVQRFRSLGGATSSPAAAVDQLRDAPHHRAQRPVGPVRPQLCSGEWHGVPDDPRSRLTTILPAALERRPSRPGVHRNLPPIISLSSALDAEEGADAVRAPRAKRQKRHPRGCMFSAPAAPGVAISRRSSCAGQDDCLPTRRSRKLACCPPRVRRRLIGLLALAVEREVTPLARAWRSRPMPKTARARTRRGRPPWPQARPRPRTRMSPASRLGPTSLQARFSVRDHRQRA